MFVPSFLVRWFERRFQDGVRGTCEAMFPPNELGAPDCVGADMIPRTVAYVAMLPPTQAPLVKLLFVAIELAAPVLVPFGGRFSRRTAARRLAAVNHWRHSWWFPLRLLADALRATLHMVYFSHPDVVRFVGEYKTVANPDDPFPIDIRPLPIPSEVA